MTAPPLLTDRDALALNRRRARTDALFLHHAARDSVEDRLAMVNRTFTAPAVITPFPEVWQDLLPGARLVTDDDTLDLQTGAHDLVIHALALHWANDAVGQLIQCRRALKPDGLCLVLLPGGETLADLRVALAEAETQVCGGLSPRVLPMADLRDLGALLPRAGLALPVADSESLTAEYRDLWHLMRDLRDMGEGNALAARRRRPVPRALFDRAAGLYRARCSTDDGKVSARFDIITLTGWAPDESQPKPLRPGSATTRLAEALDTDEVNLPD